MKIFASFLFLIFIISNSFAQFRSLEKQNHTVNKLLESIIVSPDFKSAGFAFYAVDINTGETIAAVNPDMVLKPASTLKLLSTATILELLGPDYNFETALEYTGKIDTGNHFLNGDLIIKGGGDPSLGSKYFDQTNSKQFLSEWTNVIANMGVDSISGRIIADARFYSWDIIPPTWSWINMGNYYGVGPCGLSVYDNCYSVYFNTGKIVGATVKIVNLVPDIPDMVFDNTVTADSIYYDNAYIFGAPYCNNRYIRGQLPIDKQHFKVKGSMPDPAYVLALQFDSALNANKINTQKAATTIRLLNKEGSFHKTIRKNIHKTFSPGLSEIIAQTNINSINLFAEHCLIHSGIKLGASPETGSSIDSVLSFWKNKGMCIQGISLYDGSGLSQYNAISPRQMVFLLKYMKLKSNYFDTYYNSLAIAGKTGTLKNMFKGSIAKGKLRAKSGTVNHVKAFAGYVTSKSGREIAFSMAVNNFSCKPGEATEKLEQLMIALAEFKK